MDDLTSLPLLVYVGLYAVAAIDVVFPIVPSESAVIGAGVLAAHDRISLSLVVVAAAAGALTGDVLGYLLGRRYGERLVRRVLRLRGGRELAWSQSALRQNEAWVLLTARFIPVGRTAATMESGYLRLPSRRYVGIVAVAGLLWAVWSALLGYLGGQAFRDRPWVSLLLASGLVVTAVVVRRIRRAKTLGAVRRW